eukprot:GFKZ01000406.1.p1 GENE.GFKZ01000406.1~~GFKZ01000406.1.p1  ORF type:complete len:142 (-),score=2.88 GFKZ01000406.1:540-965(-)
MTRTLIDVAVVQSQVRMTCILIDWVRVVALVEERGWPAGSAAAWALTGGGGGGRDLVSGVRDGIVGVDAVCECSCAHRRTLGALSSCASNKVDYVLSQNVSLGCPVWSVLVGPVCRRGAWEGWTTGDKMVTRALGGLQAHG